jgi:hypothetical protein
MIIYINSEDGSTQRLEARSVVVETSRDKTILIEDNVMTETVRISTPGSYLRNEMGIDIEIPRRKG